MERLAGLEPSYAKEENSDSSYGELYGKPYGKPYGESYGKPYGKSDTFKTETVKLRKSTLCMLEQGKYLAYGTRLLYAGPDLGDEDYIRLNSLKSYHLSLEYLIIDEHTLQAAVPGNSKRYQMKEAGYEIL
jgi:hypothetical protein